MRFIRNIRWSDLRLMMIITVIIGLYSFANKRSSQGGVVDIQVRFNGDGDHFLTTQNVNNLLIQSLPKPFNINKSNIDLNSLEVDVQGNKVIKSADVYLTVDGKIIADIWQSRAIGRVVGGQNSFYIDSEGDKVPLSSNYTARVPIVTGSVDDSNQDKVAGLLKYIDQDEFLKKDITGITVNADQKLEIRSRDQDYKIIFGGFNDMKKKFENYKAFLNFASKDSTLLAQYKTINLKFTQQVVCTK